MKSKRVLHFITGLEFWWWAENMLLQTLPNLTWEHRVWVIMWYWLIWKKLEKKWIKVYYLNLKNILDIWIIWRYKSILNDFSPNIQINYLIHADIFWRVFWKLFWIKNVISYIRNKHIDKKILLFFDKLTIWLADFVITNSEVVLKYYNIKFWVPKNKLLCITNWIDLTRFDKKVDKNSLFKNLWLNKIIDDFNIICIWRFVSQKNHELLFKSLKEVLDKWINVNLLLLWDWELRKYLIQKAHSLWIESKVFFLWKHENVVDILKTSDAFVFPSIHEWMSNALLEAMASWIICVVSDIDENTELIKHDKTWFTFESKNVNDLALKIEYVYNHNNLNEQIINAKEMIIYKYNIKNIIKKLNDFINNIYV